MDLVIKFQFAWNIKFRFWYPLDKNITYITCQSQKRKCIFPKNNYQMSIFNTPARRFFMFSFDLCFQGLLNVIKNIKKALDFWPIVIDCLQKMMIWHWKIKGEITKLKKTVLLKTMRIYKQNRKDKRAKLKTASAVDNKILGRYRVQTIKKHVFIDFLWPN